MRLWWKKPRVGVALSGGGSRGLAHIGVLEVLSELGIEPCAIAGTSVGSIFGALAAAKVPVARMEALALGAQWMRLVRPVLPGGSGLLSLEPLEKLIEQELGKGFRFSDLRIPFACMATDIERDESIVLRTGVLAPAVRASCSVPGIFTPVELDGRLLVDGGVMNNLPVRLLESMGADYVIAVDLLPSRAESLRPKGLIEVLTATFYNMVRSNSHEGLLADMLIVPEIRAFGFADFSRRPILIERGREAAEVKRERLMRELAIGRESNRIAVLWASIEATVRRVFHRLRFFSERAALPERTETKG